MNTFKDKRLVKSTFAEKCTDGKNPNEKISQVYIFLTIKNTALNSNNHISPDAVTRLCNSIKSVTLDHRLDNKLDRTSYNNASNQSRVPHKRPGIHVLLYYSSRRSIVVDIAVVVVKLQQ